MRIRFLRVLGVRSKDPSVFAVADGAMVRWDLRRGWTCDCDTEGDECTHVDAVDELLDPRVTDEVTG